MKLLAIDGNSILNRSYYGIRLLSNKKGVYTNAIFGFLNIMLKLIRDIQPDAVAVAFDVSAPTFRHELFDQYKATRKGMPDELRMQMPLIKEILTLMGHTIIECPGYEGDDILGTLAKICEESDNECYVSTGDRDNLQLINDHVKVMLATTKETILFDTDRFVAEYGIQPHQLIDVKALMGDSSDNIPGVKGIGEKGASDMIQRYGSIEYIYENFDSVELKPRARTLMDAGKEMAFISKELATINKFAPISNDVKDYYPKAADLNGLTEKLIELELNTFIEKLSLSIIAEEQKQSQVIDEYTIPITITTNITLENLKKQLSDYNQLDFFATFSDDLPSSISIRFNDCSIILNDNSVTEILDFLLSTTAFQKRTTESKQLYRYALAKNMQIQNLIFDASLAGYLLNPSAKGYGVDLLIAEYVPSHSFEQDEFTSIAVFSMLCDKLQQEVDQKGMTSLLQDIELPLSEVLASMELVGFGIDVAGVQAFGEMLCARIETLRAELFQLAGGEFNPNSTKELGEILFNQLMLPAKKKTKNGYSTDVEVLEALRGKHPIIEPLLEYRKLAKLNSTYVVGLLKVMSSDNRVHSIFKQTETRTGRISSTEPNMQNIPIKTELGSRMRGFFIAREGYTLLDADYSQIELRILAHISNDKVMIEAFNDNLDIHAITASEVFDVPQLLLSPIMRNRAKAINFGIVYGIGAFSLSQDINVSVSEAKTYIENYFDTYRGVKKYLDHVIETSTRDGFVTTMFGRRRDLPELAQSNKNIKAFGERLAMNTPIQGSAADIIKIAMIRVYRRLLDEKLDAKLILQVHDELLIEVGTADVEKANLVLQQEMQGACELLVPLLAEVHEGKSWLDAK